MKKVILIFLLLIAANPISVYAIYKWTDNNGIVHFTDFPPSGNENEYVDVELDKNLSDLNDSFGDGLLDKGWIKVNIDSPDSLIEKGDSLTFLVPGDRDIWYDRFDAPVIFKKIKKVKDFLVEVKLGFTTNGSDKAGIVLWTDKRGKGDIVLICKSKAEDINFRRIIGSDSVKGNEPIYDKDKVIFRLSRKGDSMTGSYSEDGTDWTDLGTVDFSVEGPLNIGIFGSSWKDVPAKITFDYFSIKEQ